MKKIGEKIKAFLEEVEILTNNVPSLWVSFFFLSVVGMNLLANKSIRMNVDWLALDTAFLFSWLSFLTNDVITKRFGPRAANIISIIALLANLLFAFIFWIVSVIPGDWSNSKDENNNTIDAINDAFDKSFGGTWFIIVGSSAAFLSSAILNNMLNWSIGKCFKGNPNGFCAFALRSYVSTAIGQFFDNFVFAIIVSYHFFDWSIVKVISASFLKMLAELLFEVIFSPIGYIYLRYMEKNEIGKGYLDLYPIESQDNHQQEIKPNNDEDLEAGLNVSNNNNNNEE